MNYDVVIVGAGPAGLACAIALKQQDATLTVCVLEKASEIGGHILSGAVLEPTALTELIPDWQQLDVPLETPVTEDAFFYLSEKKSYALPTPKTMQNHGNYIIRLSHLCVWLAKYAETLGVEIYAGFTGSELVFDTTQNKVCGIKTGDFGLDKHGQPTERHQPGMELLGKVVILAEGCRGSLSKQAMARFNLLSQHSPQTYAIGLKEVWQIPAAQHQIGKVIHTVGWPLDHRTYGGSFIYHLNKEQVALGLVIGLDYRNPYLDTHAELQRMKNHPLFATLLNGGERIAYGARALVEGGWQALPTMHFPGGLLVGDSAGLINVPKIKGIHQALRAGRLAAEVATQHIKTQLSLEHYTERLRQSDIGKELYRVRNIRPAFKKGLWCGMAYAALDTYVLHGHTPWTFKHTFDHLHLQHKNNAKLIHYPKPDGKLTFDKMSSVQLTNTFHAEDQPCHLQLSDPTRAIKINLEYYDAPEQRYCPAGVYEIIKNANQPPYLQINAGNCIHCKTCDIKDPMQNITWQVPEGGQGPRYPGL